MMFQYALRSLKNDFSKAFFYCLTFILTTTFIFLFFNIAMGSEANVHFIHSANDSATNVTVIIIAICMIIIFFANDFFVKNKAKELAVRLISGATYFQLASFLLIQTFLLLIIAIPIGIFLGLCLIPIINVLMSSFLGAKFVFTLNPSAIFMTTLILVAVVFWTTYLNMAFAYRHTAVTLLNERDIKISLKENFMNQMGMDSSNKIGKTIASFKTILFLGLWIMPIFMFYLQIETSVIWAIVGLIGLNGVISYILEPLFTILIQKTKSENINAIVYLGFLRNDINILRLNICLFLACAILLISMLVSIHNSPIETALILLSYTVMNLLQSLAILFKFSTELSTRKRYFRTLEQLGYLRGDLSKIIWKEVTIFYLIILVVALLYVGNLLCSDVIQGFMDYRSAWTLTFCLVVPMLISMALNLFYYHHTMLGKEKGTSN